MDERHEIIEFSPVIPVKFFLHKLGVVGKHWHKSLELLLVLDGKLSITVDEETYHLENEDIILINSNSIHELHSESAVMIAVQFKPEIFSAFNLDPDQLIFDCNTVTNPDPDAFQGLRFGIARMLRENSHRSEGTDFKNISLSYFLISELLDHFKIQETDEIKVKKKYMVRLANIIDYIQLHYRENFTLSDLAESQQLSVPYLSSFFNKHMGINFSQYYTNVKLDHAVADLRETDLSIEEIALQNGFTESHAFVRSFKKRYQMLPSAWRKEHTGDSGTSSAQDNLNYIRLEPSNYLHLMTKYLPMDRMFSTPSAVKTDVLDVGNISVRTSGLKLTHNFKTCITVGRAKELLNKNIQDMLRDIQTNIGYRYIKFHGILSDDMLVCTRDPAGNLHFAYTYVDMVLDFLLSIGLKPFLQLSFMPKALASDPAKNLCQSPFNTSPPADMEEWNALIRDFTAHLFARFGRKEVISWPFCVWNEPMTSAKMFGFSDDRKFFDFYKNT